MLVCDPALREAVGVLNASVSLLVERVNALVESKKLDRIFKAVSQIATAYSAVATDLEDQPRPILGVSLRHIQLADPTLTPFDRWTNSVPVLLEDTVPGHTWNRPVPTSEARGYDGAHSSP